MLGVSGKSGNVDALIEHAAGGIFRSDDKGETWTRMSDTNPRGMYFSQVRIDPNNDQKVWVLGAPLYYTEDGGRTFRQDRWQKIHSDFHAFWVEDTNSLRHASRERDIGLDHILALDVQWIIDDD